MDSRKMYNAKLATRLNDRIKEAFTFPFTAEKHCKPDGSTHDVYDRMFHLNGHLVVLYNTKLFPGLTFQALEANTGDLNVFTQNVKFEINIPTIGGYFYVVSEDKDVKPVHVRGSFKIDYDTAIAKGITSYFMNGSHLAVSSMAIDFDLVEKPRVTFYSDEADGSIGQLDSDRSVNGAKVAEELWPNTQALLYWILRDKLWKISSKLPWNDVFVHNNFHIYDGYRRSKVAEVSKEIIVKLKRKLRAIAVGGRLAMPNIDLMVEQQWYPKIWGRFKATSGWLGDIASIRLNDKFDVHAKSKDEIVLMGQIHFNDWKYCYDEYTMEGNGRNAMGEIVRTLGDNDAFIEITAIRDENGKVTRKYGRFEYINATNVNNDVTELGEFGWLKDYVNTWMSALMDAGKPTLNDTINKCLNEVLEEIDLFGYWDDVYTKGSEDMSQNSTDDESDPSDNDHYSDSEDDSVGSSITNGWDIL